MGSGTTSTSTQQPDFEIVDRDFEVSAVDPSNETDRASVSRSMNVVTVEGTLQASNDCYTAKITEIITKPELDYLRIQIETVRRNDEENCSSKDVGIPYEVKLKFAKRTPGHVAVLHNGEQANSGSEVDHVTGSHLQQ